MPTDADSDDAQATPRMRVGDGVAPALAAGDRVGRYEVRGVLGTGGMGQVFTAFDPGLGRSVALKLIRPDGRAPSARARSRLLREAQALAKLQHPNVVTIYDVGTDGDQVFIAMELIRGETAAHWLAQAPRSWRAVRDVFLAAGRGLAAAHGVGIVHRDFKPSNVIVGAERVVVIDFGLARGRGAVDPDDSPSPLDPGSSASILDVELTLTGERVGTPRYMAPEQHLGARVTALADQFAFATALWSSLYGAAPFAGDTRAELLRAFTRGPAPPPADRQVPERVRAALTRALALRPEDRWPTLGELLRELAHDPVIARRRAVLAGAIAGAALIVGGLAFTLGRTAATPELCAGAAALVAPLWDDARQAEIRAAFRRTGRPYADDTFERVDASLRRRLEGWTLAHRDACEATHVRHEQSTELLDARMACLGHARMEIAELVGLLGDADAEVLDRAAPAAERVGDVSLCADAAALREETPQPRDPRTARDVAELRADVARLTALRALGKVEEGLAAGRELVQRARVVGYAPLLAAALHAASWFELTAGDSGAAVELGYDGARVAAEAHDDALVAESLGVVAYALGYGLQRFDAAAVAHRAALAAAARAGNPGALLEHLYGDRATVVYTQGDYAAALPLSVVVFVLSVRLHGADSYQAAQALQDLIDCMTKLHHAVADATFERALRSAQRALGSEHPVALALLNSAGLSRLAEGDFDAAASFFERALEAKQRGYPADSPSIAISAHNLGMARRGERRLPEARALLERAIRIRTAKLGAGHPLVASSHDQLASVAELEGRGDEALAHVETALAIMRRAPRGAHPEQAWTYRHLAELLLARGRLAEARAALADGDAVDREAGASPAPTASSSRLAGEIALAEHRPAEARAHFERALPLLEARFADRGKTLLPTLLGLSGAQLALGDVEDALATAERALAIAGEGGAIEDQCAAELLVARARWAGGRDRAAAVALARRARAKLAAVPYRSTTRLEIDRWLRRVAR